MCFGCGVEAASLPTVCYLGVARTTWYAFSDSPLSFALRA